ncbi:MAG: hypothetical protein P1V81_16765 [Planctomycetota bacterium]|nr:hypothetical protein [Planctomycetota bacterium]
MKLAALQVEVRRGDLDHNLAAAEAAFTEAAAAGAAVVLLPELWPTAFPDSADPGTGANPGDAALAAANAEALAQAARWSAESGILVAGSYLAPGPNLGGAGPGRFFNRLVVHEAGREVLVYDKVHLFTPTAEHEVFAAGDLEPAVVRTSVGLVSGVVCYDLRFGELFRGMAAAGVELLLAPAQWPERRASHWRGLVTGRAVEGQFAVLATNRRGTETVGRRGLELVFPGNSLVVDPAGRVLAEGSSADAIVLAEVDLDAARRQRVRVPVAKDRREGLYRSWGAAGQPPSSSP